MPDIAQGWFNDTRNPISLAYIIFTSNSSYFRAAKYNVFFNPNFSNKTRVIVI